MTKASLGSAGTQKLPSFLASLFSLSSSSSLVLYSLQYFSALLKTSTFLAFLAILLEMAALALRARLSACLFLFLRMVSGTAGNLASGIVCSNALVEVNQAIL